jgi:hypothetical protein
MVLFYFAIIVVFSSNCSLHVVVRIPHWPTDQLTTWQIDQLTMTCRHRLCERSADSSGQSICRYGPVGDNSNGILTLSWHSERTWPSWRPARRVSQPRFVAFYCTFLTSKSNTVNIYKVIRSASNLTLIFLFTGDHAGTWQPSPSNFLHQYLIAEYDVAVYLTSVDVFETWHPGGVVEIYAWNEFSDPAQYDLIWQADSMMELLNPDPTETKAMVITRAVCPKPYPINKIKLVVLLCIIMHHNQTAISNASLCPPLPPPFFLNLVLFIDQSDDWHCNGSILVGCRCNINYWFRGSQLRRRCHESNLLWAKSKLLWTRRVFVYCFGLSLLFKVKVSYSVHRATNCFQIKSNFCIGDVLKINKKTTNRSFNVAARTALVSVNLTAVNDPPVANDMELSVLDGPQTVVAIVLDASDIDGSVEDVEVLTQPTHGQVSLLCYIYRSLSLQNCFVTIF